MHPCYQIFLVDDSALVRQRLRELLTVLPGVAICGEAARADKAIEQIRVSGADAVVLDVDLEAGSGLDVLRAVKRLPAPPVVAVLTIHPFRAFGRHYLGEGADHYFEKGADFDAICNLFDQLSAARG
ncbi:MAG TPA: response regulator [Opitutus sp.]|nr:response regulator [Opitutus sp.]